MKTPPLWQQVNRLRTRGLARLLLSAAALLALDSSLRAASDITIDTFDTSASAAQWSKWWGAAPQTYEWDGTVDADGSASSGSLKVTINFNLASYGGDNQFSALRPFSTVEGSQYTNLVFDLKWDQASPRRQGDFGFLEPGFRNQDYSQNVLTPFAVSTNQGWIHVVLPINSTAPKIDTINGLFLKMWSGDPAGMTGKAVFWVDNIRLIAKVNVTPPPPPTLGIEKALPGLKFFASAPGNPNQRQSVRTKNAIYSWVGATDPVTYSLTIADYPGSSYSGFQTHIFLVPGANIPNYETSPDWNEPNIVFLQIGNNADGSGYASFRYKTNLPNGNSMLFGSGTLATVGSTTVKGTWNLTFNPDGQISLASPSGLTTNFTLPADAVTLFSGPLYAYFGIQPNNAPAIGQAVTITQFQITGVAIPVGETFIGGSLNPDSWEKVADDAGGIIPVAQDAICWINWSLPDKDFTLQYQDGLIAPSTWRPVVGSAAQIGDRRRLLLRAGNAPLSQTGNMFYQLLKP
ncbi:MAG: hypothetical protein JWM16_5135 [Verrucomicrobiales bacterium]|nr:hypothetical protein [Verrucomicrobiales bacterium]